MALFQGSVSDASVFGRRIKRAILAASGGLLLLAATASAQSPISLVLKPTTVVMGSATIGTVTLDAPAPPEGLIVFFSSQDPAGAAAVPGGVVVNGGATAATFSVATNAVFSSSQVLIQATANGVNETATFTVTPREPVRGLGGDLWADVIIGKPDFGEIGPNQIVASRVFQPGGSLVDRSATPNRLYVYDSGNSRVLGLSHLGNCQGNPLQTCTTNSDCGGSAGSVCDVPDVCVIPAGGLAADLVLGQPSFTTGACNGDSAFQTYPRRAPATASSLCGMQESQVSISEGFSFVNMAVDGAGNLYVPDFDNHRVVRYDLPFTTDRIADHVWGQADFAGNDCNRGRGVYSAVADGLCFRNPFDIGFVAGVDIDSAGNLWVADSSNHRVLRFPVGGNGVPLQLPDLVLGQPDFTSSDYGTAMNQMCVPGAVRVAGNGTVYVADGQNGCNLGSDGRVLVFSPPYSNGMAAGGTLGSGFRAPTGLDFDPVTGGLWVNDSNNHQLLLFVGGVVQKVLFKSQPDYSGSCGQAGNVDDCHEFYSQGDHFFFDSHNDCGSVGSVGVDRDGNVYAHTWYWQDLWRFPAPIPAIPQTLGSVHSADKRVFEPYQLNVPNQVGFSGLANPNGVAVTSGPAGQLITAEPGRLLFWNNPSSLTNGKTADGFASSSGSADPFFSGYPRFGRIQADQGQHLWTLRGDHIAVYSLPLLGSDTPSTVLASPLPVQGMPGTTISWNPDFLIIGGVAPVGSGSKVWVSDTINHRVLRVSNPLTSPVVDVILGQVTVGGTLCNQGNGDETILMPGRNTLCRPGAVALDPQGNVYVSDAALEISGNERLLEFDAALFPDAPSSVILGTDASRVFGRGGDFNERNCQDQTCGPWQPAFTTDGQMVVGLNGYIGSRFPVVYRTPLASQQVDTYLNDFHSMAYAAAFDAANDLYVMDGNRSRVLIYRHPLNPTIAITSFTPASGPPGTSVTINGMGFTGATSVKFNGATAAFTVNTDTQITATVPSFATTGPISVTATVAGTATSATNFVVGSAPTITSFSPASGAAGVKVTINGTNFAGAISVAFNGVSATYTINSAIKLTAAVPPGDTTGKISVTTSVGSATSVGTFTGAPRIYGFSPGSGTVGTSVVITGVNFTGATAAKFNGTTSAFHVDSSAQITATVPANGTTGPISVTNVGGTATSSPFTFTVAPRIASFTPTSGPVGTSVAITGANFTSASSVSFSGISATSTFNSTSRITATVPSGAATGPITVSDPSGGTTTSAASFTVNLVPAISGFSPASGGVGIAVILDGVNFTGTTSVKFNGIAAAFTRNSDIKITATVPGNATTGKITVTNPAGTATSATDFTVAARITSFTPTSGVIGTSVTINGANFTGVSSVKFNGVPAVYTLNSPIKITATVPAGATTGKISVTTPVGTVTSTGNFTVKPNITGFTPTSGNVGVGVTITGTAFTGASAVKFNGASAAFAVNSSTQITATVPANATTGPISVTTAGGIATSATSFTVAPRITSFTPTSGAVGTTVTINGANFTAASAVSFNGVPATPFTINSASKITTTVPAGATTGKIAVTNPAGTGTSAVNFVIP